MTITASNKLLQGSVGYLIQEQVGAVAKDDLSISYDIDSGVSAATVFTYGEPVILGSNKGAAETTSGSGLSDLIGFVKMDNAGIIDGAGIPNTLYSTLPVLKRGAMYLAASGTMDLNAKVGLCVDPAKPAWKTVVDITSGTPTGCIDISTIAKVLKKAANSVVLVDVRVL